MPTPKISLLPDKLDLAFYAGDGVRIQLTVTNNEGDPIAIEDGITAQIRETRMDADPLVEFDYDVDVDDLGVVTLILTGDQTASLITDEPIFRGVWDVQWVQGGQEPVTLAQGKVEVDADVTRV